MTQDDLSLKLNISRQAVSSWENNKNLPDIELLTIISKTFNISLDDLILGENNSMEEKLINDGSENKKVKMYMISNIVGFMLCILGIFTLFLKGLSVEYIDSTGILHENFFLVPLSFIFILIGIVIIFIGLIYYFKKTNDKKYLLNKIGYLISIVSFIMTLLIYSNGNKVSIISILFVILGLILIII